MRTQLAGLDSIVLQQDTAKRPRAALMMCHGFGASGDDLAGLHQVLMQFAPSLSDVRFYFPAAPNDLGQLGMPGARAWWMINLDILTRWQNADAEALADHLKKEPEGLKEARRALMKYVDAVQQQEKFSNQQLILGGFSQGAMLATDVALRLEESVRGLVVWSGALIAQDIWKERAQKRSQLKVFQSHGRQDTTLKFQLGESLHHLFDEAKIKNEFHVFDGGHEIPLQVIRDFSKWLTQLLS